MTKTKELEKQKPMYSLQILMATVSLIIVITSKPILHNFDKGFDIVYLIGNILSIITLVGFMVISCYNMYIEIVNNERG